MDTYPAFHPHNSETAPNMALAPETATGVPGCRAGRDLVPVPCSPEFDPDERRAYGGVMASVLAGLATYFVALRLEFGLGPYIRRLARLSRKVEHALYIYTRVKEAMAFMQAPEEIEIEVNRDGEVVTHPNCAAKHKRRARHTRRQDHTDWAAFKRERGYDMRGTSLRWVERQSRNAKSRARKAAREAYIEEKGLLLSFVKQERTPVQEYDCATTSEPAPLVLGEIWPPVPIPTKSEAKITVVQVQVPRPDAFIQSEGRKVGLDNIYEEFYSSAENYAHMWDGEINVWQRAPPGG